MIIFVLDVAHHLRLSVRSLCCCVWYAPVWPSDTRTGTRASGWMPGILRMAWIKHHLTEASSVSGVTSSSSTPWSQSLFTLGTHSQSFIPEMLSSRLGSYVWLCISVWRWSDWVRVNSLTGICRCTTLKKTRRQKPEPQPWTNSWVRSNTSSLIKPARLLRISWPLKSAPSLDVPTVRPAETNTQLFTFIYAFTQSDL